MQVSIDIAFKVQRSPGLPLLGHQAASSSRWQETQGSQWLRPQHSRTDLVGKEPVGRAAVTCSVFDPSKTPSFKLDDLEDLNSEVSPSPPPTEGRFDITVTKDQIRQLDLSPAHAVLRQYVAQVGDYVSEPPSPPSALLQQRVGFVFEYERDDPLDPRELSELPDVKLWFVRLDTAYPWLPAVLDWRAGELGRYAAMLVPHQMTRRTGLVFNPEALEVWMMAKLFVSLEWLKARGVQRPEVRAKDMARVLGFTIGDSLFPLLEATPHP